MAYFYKPLLNKVHNLYGFDEGFFTEPVQICPDPLPIYAFGICANSRVIYVMTRPTEERQEWSPVRQDEYTIIEALWDHLKVIEKRFTLTNH